MPPTSAPPSMPCSAKNCSEGVLACNALPMFLTQTNLRSQGAMPTALRGHVLRFTWPRRAVAMAPGMLILSLAILNSSAARLPVLQRRSPDARPAARFGVGRGAGRIARRQAGDFRCVRRRARQSFRVHSVLKGGKHVSAGDEFGIVPDAPVEKGSLVLLLGSGADDAALSQLSWTAIPVDESSYGYIFREPTVAVPQAERLKYFARYLENRNPLVADDALQEFAHASFDDTVQAARTLPMANCAAGWSIRKSLRRKGFYGLALGLAIDPGDRRLNEKVLHRQIIAPASDFRAGFDGLLGGYLLLTGQKGLELLDSRYFANPKAAIGDVQHAMRALRFYHQFGHGIDPVRQAEALSHTLVRRNSPPKQSWTSPAGNTGRSNRKWPGSTRKKATTIR